MGQQIEQLAEFVATTGWDDIPAPVQQHAKLVLLDTLGVILAGSERPEVRELRDQLTKTAGADATVFAPGRPTSDTRTAALLNGIAGRSIELCEGHRLVSSQSAVQVLPGVLAIGEAICSSGQELMAALILGYDVATRLCAAFTAMPLAHQNGQATLPGAVAAGARLRGLDARGISKAMRIATTLIMTPSYTNVVAGATALNVAGGMSGLAAAFAPELAVAGFEAQDNAIEQALGELVGSGFDPGALLDELATCWEITRNYFRLYACCNPIHPSLDALQVTLDELKPQPEDVARIDITTYRFASVMRNRNPPNYFASKYSLPHAAAAMVVNGNAGYASLDDKAVTDPTIAALRHRVHVDEDAEMSTVVPRLRPARVTLTLMDGRQAVRQVESHRGDFMRPFTEPELRAKFRELAGTVLTHTGVLDVEDAVDHCQDWISVVDLVECLRRSSVQNR